MTGVTVPEWGAILMLRSLKSPESYFQAAFRVQSPWRKRHSDGTVEVLKNTCYVFEFDPNRALSLVAEYGMRLGSNGDMTPSEAISQLLDYLPIYQFSGGAMTALDAGEVMGWATAGIGATALAQRWNSSVLVDVSQATLSALLAHPELLQALEQIEDFRNLTNTAQQIITSTKALKKAKREQHGKLDPDQMRQRSETSSQRKEIREKLQKFVAKVPVFMYVTDFREEALKDVIESLDSAFGRARHGADRAGLPPAQQHRRVQRSAHELGDLPVQAVRACQPALRRCGPSGQRAEQGRAVGSRRGSKAMRPAQSGRIRPARIRVVGRRPATTRAGKIYSAR